MGSFWAIVLAFYRDTTYVRSSSYGRTHWPRREQRARLTTFIPNLDKPAAFARGQVFARIRVFTRVRVLTRTHCRNTPRYN